MIVSMAASDIWIAHGMPEGLFAGDAFARHVFKSLMAKWKELNGAEEGKALIGTIIWPADAVPLEACPVAMRWAGAGTGLRAERGTLSVGVASLVIWVGKTRAQMLLKDTKGLFCTRHAVGEMFVMGKRPRLNQYWVPVVPLQSYSLFSLNLRAEGILKADHGKSSLTLAEFFMVSIVNEARRRGLMMLFTDGTSPPAPDELPITPYDQVHKSTDTFIRNSLTMSCIKACALMSVASLVHASRGEAVDGPPFRQAMIHTFQSDDRWGILPFWHWRPTTEHIETSPIKDIMNYLFTTDQTGVDALDATLWPHEYVRKFVGNALRRHLFKCPRVSEQ